MTRTTLYGLKQCSTCVKAREWLKAHNVEHDFVDYRDAPVAPATSSPTDGGVEGRG